MMIKVFSQQVSNMADSHFNVVPDLMKNAPQFKKKLCLLDTYDGNLLTNFSIILSNFLLKQFYHQRIFLFLQV